jgi:pyridoxal phosphate enzyme (YggS family)
VDKTALIHSVDSIRLAEQIQSEAEKKSVICDILLEINIAREESKFGLSPEEVLETVEKVSVFPNVRIRGLMTVAPFVENPEENRIHFQNMKKLMVDIAQKNINNVCMDILSMGMTGDYEVAIEEGATHVRVGTGIFGERNYHICQ